MRENSRRIETNDMLRSLALAQAPHQETTSAQTHAST
jgi:hypothetical protein